MNKSSIKSICFLFGAAIIWGFAFCAQVEAGKNGLGCFSYNGIRFTLGAFSLIPVIMIFERGGMDKNFIKDTFIPGVIAGVVVFGATALQQYGINLNTNASKSSFITGLYIVLVPIAAWLIFGHKTKINVWIGAAFALVGLYFLCVIPGQKLEKGDLFVFFATFFWMAHILIVDRFSEKMQPLKFSMVQFFVCGVIQLILATLFEQTTVDLLVASKWVILYGGVLSSGVAYTCQVIGQKDSDPTVATIILSLESVFGAIGGVIINDEKMSARGIFGCVLMFIGIIVSQIEIKKKKLCK